MSGIQRMQRPIAIREYSGSRLAEYQRITEQRRLGEIDRQQFARQVHGLNVLEDRYKASLQRRAEKRQFEKEQREAFEREIARQAERQRREEMQRLSEIRARQMIEEVRKEREAKEAKRKAQAEARKAKKALGKSKVASVESFKESIRDWLNGEEKDQSLLFELPIDLLSSMKLKDGMTIQSDLMNGSTVVDSYSTTIKGNDLNSIFHYYNYSDKVIGLRTDKKNQTRFIADESIADKIMKSSDLRVTVFQPIVAKMKKQAFREGIEHCVFQPMITYFEKMKSNATNDRVKWNFQRKINKAKKLAIQYEKGVPESDLELVAKTMDTGIIIHSVFNKVLFDHRNRKGKTLQFINSEINHVTLLSDMHEMNIQAEVISKEEGIEIINQCIRNKLWNRYEGTMTYPRKILTCDKAYIIGDKRTDTMLNFTKSFDRGIAIDLIKEPELCNFLLSGVNLMINFKNKKCKGSPVAEIDMKKAYTQFKRCSVYQGFPSIITNVRDCAKDHDVVTHCGIYQVQIKKMTKTLTNAKKIELAKEYGFTEHGRYVLASPWIVKLREIGCEVDVMYGAWGKRMDFEFSEKMMEEKAYAIWVGMQMRHEPCVMYKMACDPEFAEVVMAQHLNNKDIPIEDIQYNQITQTILTKTKKENHYIMPHISATIVAYTQIQVFEEACKYKISEIVAHKLDSIVLTREPLPFDTTLWENPKEKIAMNKYTSPFIFKTNLVDLPRGKVTPYLGDCFISGQGGSGKTHIVMTDNGFRNKHFVSTSWELVSEKMVEYKCRGGSVNQLLGFDIHGKKIQSHKDKFGQPPTIMHDEGSMTNVRLMNKIKEMYPYSQLIVMGDYDKGKYYQSSVLTNGDKLYHPLSYHMIDADYRSVDEETRQFKLQIRNRMDRDESLIGYLHEMIPTVTMDELKKEYSMDYVMTGVKDRIWNTFNPLLTSDKNWYKVTKHTMDDVIKKCSGQEAYLHGEVLDFPIEGRTEIAHASTVHSFQGKTIPVHKKCFVDLSYLRCNQDIYTAISRVRSIHQLRIIKSDFPSVIYSNGMYNYQ